MKSSKIRICLLSAFAVLALSGCGANESESVYAPPIDDSSSLLPDTLEGSGTESDPYLLDSAADFVELAALINAETEQSESYLYVDLEQDVDLSSVSFEGFGTAKNMFYGEFDGGSHAIQGLSITEYNKEKTYYGLFNAAYMAEIHDFSLSYDIALPVVGVGAAAYAGGVVGVATDTILYGITATGNTMLTTTSSQTELIAGGIAGAVLSASGYYVYECNLAHYGDVSTDADGETTGSGYAGGIAGYVYTGGSGIVAFLSSLNEGSVSTLDDAGGIIGRSDYYVSIQDCVATGEKIATSRTTGSYAGGIAGVSGYETLVARNYVSFDEISAPNSTSSSYSSYAGAITGYYAVDDVTLDDSYRYDNYLGTGNYANYRSPDIAISGDVKGIAGVLTSNPASDLALSEAWTIDTQGFALSMDAKYGQKIVLTLKANYEGGADETIDTFANDYDADAIETILAKDYDREGYSFFDYFYDEELTAQYRFYVPFFEDSDLYAAFGDLSEILGTYQTSMSSINTGYWHITEDKFNWINMYYETFSYDYRYYKGVIYLGEGGAYEDCLIFLEDDGTLQTVDINDSDYVYVGTKSDVAYTMPDYTDASYLGEWYNASGYTFTLKKDGNASGYRKSYTGGTLEETGGFRVSGNTLDIKISQVCYGEFVYNEEKGLLIGDSTICARNEFSISMTYSYSSADGETKINIFVLSDGTEYTSVNKVLSSYTGTLQDGGEIVIDGITYSISGTTLSLKEDGTGDDGDDDEPVVTTSDITGTWTCDTTSGIEITFNADGTGTYDNGTVSSFTYTIDYATGTGTISAFGAFDGSSNTITINADGTISVHLEDEYAENVVTLIFSKEESNALVGTWKNDDIILTINEDGTGTYNNGTSFSITIDFTTGKVTGTPFDEDTVYVSLNDDGTLKFTFEQDYEGPYTLTFTKSA